MGKLVCSCAKGWVMLERRGGGQMVLQADIQVGSRSSVRGQEVKHFTEEQAQELSGRGCDWKYREGPDHRGP